MATTFRGYTRKQLGAVRAKNGWMFVEVTFLEEIFKNDVALCHAATQVGRDGCRPELTAQHVTNSQSHPVGQAQLALHIVHDRM